MCRTDRGGSSPSSCARRSPTGTPYANYPEGGRHGRAGRDSGRVPRRPEAGAVATDGMWSGTARTEAGMVSGWHHHGEYETTIYVLTGALLMEFGPGGSSTVEARPGDFVYVPKGAVHRESNPSAGPADIVVVRAGLGESTINVDGPA